MPKAVPEQFSGTGVRVDEFQGDSRITDRTEWRWHPVKLLSLLPGDDIESTITLVRECETDEVVIRLVIDVERAFEVNASEDVRSCRRKQRDKESPRVR